MRDILDFGGAHLTSLGNKFILHAIIAGLSFNNDKRV